MGNNLKTVDELLTDRTKWYAHKSEVMKVTKKLKNYELYREMDVCLKNIHSMFVAYDNAQVDYRRKPSILHKEKIETIINELRESLLMLTDWVLVIKLMA